ncbi:MAG: XRE family transcriptional regulator [Chitinophagales bacterium]
MGKLNFNIRFIRVHILKLTQKKFAKKLGITRELYQTFESGSSEPRATVLGKIAEISNIPMEIILKESVLDYTERKHAIVPLSAQAGIATDYVDEKYIYDLEPYHLPLQQLSNVSSTRIFEIKGNSMLPIRNGDYILTKKAEIKRISDIKDYATYIIILEDFEEHIVYKRVKKLDENRLMLISDNREYLPKIIDIESVVELWLAIGSISFELEIADTEELNSYLQSIENRVV